jgi:hypothetical protein
MESKVMLSLEEPVKMAGGTWVPEWLEVYLRQHQTGETQIGLERGSLGYFYLTLHEARDLARALYAAIDTATAVKS